MPAAESTLHRHNIAILCEPAKCKLVQRICTAITVQLQTGAFLSNGAEMLLQINGSSTLNTEAHKLDLITNF